MGYQSVPWYEPVPTCLQTPYIYCGDLIKRAHDLEFFALQTIYVSRAILHVIITIANQLTPAFNKGGPDLLAFLEAEPNQADLLRSAPLLSDELER